MRQQASFAQATPDVLLQVLKVCILAKRPVFTWGSPGIGKSDLHRQLADDLNRPLYDLRASQWDAVDTRGVPFLYDIDGEGEQKITEKSLKVINKAVKATGWAIPDVFPRDPDSNAIIFLDELNSAAPSVQAALYQLILDRRLGDYIVPENVVIVAAGNLETDRAVTHRMSAALADRFFHVQMLIDNDAWERWAIKNDIHIALISYIRWRPENLHVFDPKSPSKSQASPRGYEYVSDILKVCEREGINGQVEATLITAKLGEAVGAEVIGFLPIYRNLQDPDAVIMDPMAADVSDDAAINWALCGALADRASDNNIDRIIQYAERLRDHPDVGPEFMTLLMRRAARKPGVTTTRGFIKWATENKDVLI